MTIKTLFWKHYIEADEIERHKMIDTLFNNKNKGGFFKCVDATILQSYFDDLIEYLTIDKPINKSIIDDPKKEN